MGLALGAWSGKRARGEGRLGFGFGSLNGQIQDVRKISYFEASSRQIPVPDV